MYELDDLYDGSPLEELYFDKKGGGEEQSSKEPDNITSFEDVNSVLDDFVITEYDADVLRYQKDIWGDVNSSEALRADREFEEVKKTRSKFSERQLRSVGFETTPEELPKWIRLQYLFKLRIL